MSRSFLFSPVWNSSQLLVQNLQHPVNDFTVAYLQESSTIKKSAAELDDFFRRLHEGMLAKFSDVEFALCIVDVFALSEAVCQELGLPTPIVGSVHSFAAREGDLPSTPPLESRCRCSTQDDFPAADKRQQYSLGSRETASPSTETPCQ